MTDRQELYAQLAALLAAQGTPMTPEIEALMAPLLEGSMSYADHRAMLEQMIGKLDA